MIVTEVKHGLKYDKESGKQKDSFKCLFYSTSAGAFEENWFRLDEIKLIEKGKSLFSDHENHDLTHLKKKLIGTKADRKSTRLNSSHVAISYAVFCLKKKKI